MKKSLIVLLAFLMAAGVIGLVIAQQWRGEKDTVRAANINNGGFVAPSGEKHVFWLSANGSLGRYTYSSNGSGAFAVLDPPTDAYAAGLQLDGNMLYYKDRTGAQSFYQWIPKTGEAQKVGDAAVYFPQIQGEFVYYLDSNDSFKLYRMNKSGGEKECLSDDTCNNPVVTKKGIYYSNITENAALYFINLDGKGRREIVNESASFINIADGYAYYVHEQTSFVAGNITRTCAIRRIALNGGGNPVQLYASANAIEDLIVYGGKAYYIEEEGVRVWDITHARGGKLTQGGVANINICDGLLFISPPDASKKAVEVIEIDG